MGAFLAALGAVLLFILRVIGILLLVVLILLVLLLLCPFCADLCWEHGVLTVKAGALGITFPVFKYPKPEPPPAPENPEPPRGFGKVKAKFAAWRAERKRKKAEEKARKKAAAAKANKPAQPRKKAKITLEILCTMLKGAGTLTKAVFGALRITKIQVRLGVRGEDPAAAARSYGKLQAWLYPVLLNNGDKNFVNAKEKMYDHFPLTVHQMDIIIGVLFALIALFLVLGVTHTSFFGLFGG